MDIMHLMTVADFCQTIGTGRTPTIITAGGIQRIRREAVEEWIAENEERAAADTAHKASEGPLPLTV